MGEECTFSTRVDSGGRLWAITLNSISFELRKKLVHTPLFNNLYIYHANLDIIPTREKSHVNIPRGLLSTVTTAELVRRSCIFFAATKTVSLGSTVTILTTGNENYVVTLVSYFCKLYLMIIVFKALGNNTSEGITYFEFSEIMVDKEGLNIRSRSVSMNVLGPTNQTM